MTSEHDGDPVRVGASGSERARGRAGHIVRALAVVVTGWAGVVAVGFLVSPTPSPVERAVARGVYSLPGGSTPVFEAVMQAGTLTAVAVLAVLLAVARRWRVATGAVAAGLVTWTVVKLMKALVERPRPTAALLDHAPRDGADGWAFPSGHAAVSAALATVVVLMLAGRTLRGGVAAGAVGVAAVTAAARVHLGVHWPLDVLGGAVVGASTGWGTATILSALRPAGRDTPTPLLYAGRGRRPARAEEERSMTEAVYTVSGMTCDHCVNAVRTEVGALDGVNDVDVDLGTGEVRVTSDHPLDDDAIRTAVEEAGYQLSSS